MITTDFGIAWTFQIGQVQNRDAVLIGMLTEQSLDLGRKSRICRWQAYTLVQQPQIYLFGTQQCSRWLKAPDCQAFIGQAGPLYAPYPRFLIAIQRICQNRGA